jgi:hypothetical protein
MSVTPEQRIKTFFQGAPFVLLPAILLVPALKLLTICPPGYGKYLAPAVLLIFAASELWGVRKMFRCFTGKWDLTAAGSIIGSVMGVTVLLFIFGVFFLAMRAR